MNLESRYFFESIEYYRLVGSLAAALILENVRKLK